MERLFTSRHQASLTVWWNLSPLPVHGVESRCWRQLRDALYVVAGHVSQGRFHSYGIRRHLVNRARNDVLRKNKEKLLSICPATYPRKSGTWPLQTTPHLRGSKSWTCPCGCLRGSNKSNWTAHQWHFRKEASFPRLVQTVCLLLAVVFGFYWNLRPWRNSQPQKLVMGFWQRAIQ